MRYDDWQQEVINDESKYILICKGRQIGATTAMAHKAAKWMAEKGKTILVGSITEEQAKLVIVMVKDALKNYYPNMIATAKKDKPTLDKVVLKNKAWIRSRAVGTMGDAFKGFTADINWFNEMSKWPELAFISIMPTLLTTAGGMWGDSTPFGKYINGTTKKTYFFKCFENVDGRWKVYYKTSPEVIKERKIKDEWTIERREASLKQLKDQEAEMDKEQFAQEYLGLFQDEVNQWFPDDLIIEQMTEERPGTITKGKEYLLGVDVARMGEDESTFEIFERRENGHIYQVENQITKKTTLPQTFEHIKQLHRLYDFSKILIDSEGIGVGVFDWLMFDDDTKNVTEAIDNSRQITSKDGTKKLQKTLKYSWFKMMMETNKIHLLDDPNVFQSFKSTQYAYTNDSLGTRHLKIFGNYTHIAEGCTNGAWGGKHKDLNPTVYTIKV